MRTTHHAYNLVWHFIIVNGVSINPIPLSVKNFVFLFIFRSVGLVFLLVFSSLSLSGFRFQFSRNLHGPPVVPHSFPPSHLTHLNHPNPVPNTKPKCTLRYFPNIDHHRYSMSGFIDQSEAIASSDKYTHTYTHTRT